MYESLSLLESKSGSSFPKNEVSLYLSSVDGALGMSMGFDCFHGFRSIYPVSSGVIDWPAKVSNAISELSLCYALSMISLGSNETLRLAFTYTTTLSEGILNCVA